MTDWESCYQEGNTPWDRGTHAPVLNELDESHPGLFRGKILVPGCGLGHDARWFAKRGCDVTALDIAPTAIERGRALDSHGTVNFVEGSLFDLPSGLPGSFDIVWEHTCLSAMPPQLRPQYARGMTSALKPGGLIIGVFYLNPDLDPGETGPPFGLSLEELTAMWASVGMEPREHWVPKTAYEGRENRELFMILHPAAASA